MGIRGTRRGSKHNRWTESDWAIIREDLERYPPEQYSGGRYDENGLTRVGRLTLLLPGRTPVQIQNGVGVVRLRARGVCSLCREVQLSEADLAAGIRSCPACKARDQAKRQRWKAAGRCGQCGDPLPLVGSSATRCPRCVARHRPYRKSGFKSMKARSSTKTRGARGAANAIGWLCSRSSSALPVLIKGVKGATTTGIVDLFGGSGSFSIQCHEQGLSVRAYNDVHPLLVCYIRQVVREPFEDFRAAIQDILAWWSVERAVGVYRELLRGDSLTCAPSNARVAALLYLISRSVPDRKITNLDKITVLRSASPRAFRAGFFRLRRALASSLITQLDWRLALDQFDDPTTCFVVDPPWVGCAQPYDHVISSQEHLELFERLMLAKGSFIATLGSSREALQGLCDAGVPYFYWRTTFGGVREILASDQRLPTELFRSMYQIDPTSLGLKQNS